MLDKVLPIVAEGYLYGGGILIDKNLWVGDNNVVDLCLPGACYGELATGAVN